MAQQVKFYSVATGDTKPTDDNGIIFVNNGELYKGTQRFGLGRVTIAESTDGVTGAERGDIVVTGSGAGWVYVDSTYGWKPIGGDTSSLQSMWQADISTWTAGLSVGDANSYITSISQAADGKVTASAVAFPTLATGTTDGTLKLGSGDDAKVSGWDALKGRVSAIESIVDASTSTVTATTGSFTNLTVTSTATFSATTVSATTLTVDGVDVSNIAATSESDNDAGIAVTVSTANGGVTGVDVVVTSAALLQSLALSDFSGKTVVASAVGIADASNAVDTKIPTEAAVRKAIDDKVASLDNAMHYIGITETSEMTQGWTGTPTITGKTYSEKQAGDIVLKGTQEYIWNGSAWEIVGDQSAVTGGTSTSTVNDVSVTVVTAAATAFPTVTLSGIGTAASKNFADTLASTGTSLPTESAVAGYVTGLIDGLAGSASDSDKGVSVEVVTADGQVSTVDVGVTLQSVISTSNTNDEIPSAKAVSNALCWYKANGTEQW